LFRKLKDGSITSLFANKSRKLPYNKWLEAEFYPVKGLSPRKGWHAVRRKNAPHLRKEGRVWKSRRANQAQITRRKMVYCPATKNTR
jgi:hypothetical protein